jgi:hypothetical protein
MIAFLISGLLAGTALGMRFKVGSLLAASAVLLVALPSTSITLGESFAMTLCRTGLALTCVQLGYLAGAIAWEAILVTRAPRLFPRKTGPLR